MQRGVLVAAGRADPLEFGANARRLVDGELLGDGEMQRQVQERIDVARFGVVVAVRELLRLPERRVILRMERDEVRGDALEIGERSASPRFSTRRRSGTGALRRARD